MITKNFTIKWGNLYNCPRSKFFSQALVYMLDLGQCIYAVCFKLRLFRLWKVLKPWNFFVQVDLFPPHLYLQSYRYLDLHRHVKGPIARFPYTFPNSIGDTITIFIQEEPTNTFRDWLAELTHSNEFPDRLCGKIFFTSTLHSETVYVRSVVMKSYNLHIGKPQLMRLCSLWSDAVPTFTANQKVMETDIQQLTDLVQPTLNYRLVWRLDAVSISRSVVSSMVLALGSKEKILPVRKNISVPFLSWPTWKCLCPHLAEYTWKLYFIRN